MEERDIPFAVKLTDLEGWGYGEEDFRRFMWMDPGGTLVAQEGSRPVGVAVVIRYGPVAWMGAIIVDPQARGKGHGRALVEGGVAYAAEGGAETTWLNAYVHTEDFYRGLGFKTAGETLHLEGRAEGKLHPDIRLVHVGELPTLTSFDRPLFGADRRKVLEALYHDHGDGFHIWQEEGVQGYAVAVRFSGGVEVAPWVAAPERPEVAEALLRHVIALQPGAPFGLNVPKENEAGRSIVAELGFEETFRTLRMHHGPKAHGIDGRGVFSLGGLEKG